MKLIANKQTTIPKTEGVMARYSDLFIVLLNKPLQKMVTLKEMRRDMKLLDKLEEAVDTIEVSDEEYKHLSDLVENSEWAIKHIDILEFASYVESLA